MKKLSVTVVAAIAMTTIWTSSVSAKEIVVKKGDNLWNLAREHQTTVNNLLEYNNLTSSIIYPGQVLETELLHTVAKGESLWAIACHYDVTVDELKEHNNLTSELIRIGQVLTIPGVNVDELPTLNASDASVTQSSEQPAKGSAAMKQQVEAEVPSEQATEPKKEVQADEQSIKPAEPVEKEQPSEQPEPEAKEPAEQPAFKEVPTEKEAATAPQEAQTEQQSQSATVSEESQAKNDKVQQQAETGETITMVSTAYTVESAGGSGITATGINLNKNPEAKVISVDPTVIPLGTKVYVEGYGHAIAGDTGGAIKGNKIDIYLPTEEQARNWGVRTVNVTIQK